MTIHYELLGTQPACDAYRDTLAELMEQALVSPSLEPIVVDCGAHFYGLKRADFESFADFTQAIHDADYDMERK